MTRLAMLIIMLMCAVPAYALTYTGTASFDWSSLTFSGIPVTLEPERIDLHAVSLGGGTETFSEYGGFPMNAAFAGVGQASTEASETLLRTSLSFSGEGQGATSLLRETFFSAAQTGDLTVSVPYHVSQSGANDVTASVLAELQLFQGEQSQQNTVTLVTDADRSGILTVSHLFTLGETGLFTGFLSTSVQPHGASVPVPDLFWPSLFTMLVLGWAILRRRHGRR